MTPRDISSQLTVPARLSQSRNALRRTKECNFVKSIQCQLGDLKFTTRTDDIKFLFSFIETPDNFYIHPVSAGSTVSNVLKNLSVSMHNFYVTVNKAEFKKDFIPCVNDTVVVYNNNDNAFYRAIVLDIQQTLVTTNFSRQTMYLVSYFDYGNSEWVSIDDMGPLLYDFSTQPPQCVKCHVFHSILPKKLNWSAEDGQKMESLMDFSRLQSWKMKSVPLLNLGAVWLSVNQIIKFYMKNYLLRKTNRIRPSRSLYDNLFRNDNSLKK